MGTSAGSENSATATGARHRHDAALFAREYVRTKDAIWMTGDFDDDGATTLTELAVL